MFKYFHCYKFISNCFYIIFLFHFVIIFLRVSKTSAEAKILRSPAPDFNKHRIVQPVVQHGRSKREVTSTRDESGEHHSEVTIKVPIDDEEFVLDLQLNKNLITDNHVIRYQEGGKTVTHKPKKEDIDLCQYSGTVRGMPGSWVAVSTCRGVRGVIYDGEQMRYIEPAEGDGINSQHYLYDHLDLIRQYGSGNVNEVNNTRYDPLLMKHNTERHRYKRSPPHHLTHGPYNENKNSRYVELVLVADNGHYIKSGRNLHEVHRNLKDLVNIINSVYAPLNIFVALVGVEVWTTKDKIEFSRNSDRTLENFKLYRNNDLRLPNDNAHLLTLKEFDGDVVGKAFRRSICGPNSVGIATNHSEVFGLVAMTMAHEMGHNFGMDHDGDDCECADNKCIMSPYSSSYIPSLWSSCSLTSLVVTYELGMDRCLRIKPKSLFDSPTCGNGFVEPGEQCDCGTMTDPRATNPCHACCQPDTCMLRRNATCGAGACCDLQTCRPRSAGTQCRVAARECDLPEYCTGDSEFCPKDVYKMDTTPCARSDESAYCTRGWCRSHLSECQLLWGPAGQPAHPDCFLIHNMKGIRGANCGFDNHQQYLPCEKQDAVCGTLHCQHLNLAFKPAIDTSPYFMIIHYVIHTKRIEQCNVILELKPTESAVGMVPNGARCGNNEKVCLDQRCVSLEDARATLGARSCPSNCSGHGVCNSEGNCHCEAGFSPPLCQLPGAGGSPDSGPATDPDVMKYVMVVIYVTFLGILPAVLLIFIIYYFLRELVLCCTQPNISYMGTWCSYSNYNNTKRIMRNSFQNATSSMRRLLSFKSNAASTDVITESSTSHIETTIDILTTTDGTNPKKNPIRKFNKHDIHVLCALHGEPINENVITNTKTGIQLKEKSKIIKEDVHIVQSDSKVHYSQISKPSQTPIRSNNKINKNDIHVVADLKYEKVNGNNDRIHAAFVNTGSPKNLNIKPTCALVKVGPQIKPKPVLLKENNTSVNESGTQGKVANMRRMFDTVNDASDVQVGKVRIHGVKK